LLVCLALALVSFAGGIGIGTVVPRVSPLGPGPPAPAAGVRLEELKSAEELFALAGQEAVVLKYSGGDVELWVEIESQGKKERIGPVRALPGLFSDNDKPPAPKQAVEGHLLWARGEADEAGREAWRLACRRDLVAAERSGLQVATPLAQANVSQAREDRQSGVMSCCGSVRVWQGQKPRAVGSSTKGSFPSPLPTNREVCIKEIRVTGLRRDEWATVGAGTIGLLGPSGEGGPLLAASALAPGRVGPPVEEHTIKVMCKVTSDKGQGVNGRPPAN
jgi:hypothetical protein